jgi:2-polyprenyl-6-methoxyphenol hydroxylase-like FAD-dependent oxidoreductase
VIVIGAGPTGLALTCELALAGVECVLLKQRTGPRDESRASCVHARCMGLFDLRGLAETFARTGLPMPSLPLGLKAR